MPERSAISGVHSSRGGESSEKKIFSWFTPRLAKVSAQRLPSLFTWEIEPLHLDRRNLQSSIIVLSGWLSSFFRSKWQASRESVSTITFLIPSLRTRVRPFLMLSISASQSSSSFHISAGHYKDYPMQYRGAVSELLEQAVSVFSQRLEQLGERINMEGMHDEISELICDLQSAAVNSNQSFGRVARGPNDHFFLPSSAEYRNSRDSGSIQDEPKDRSVHLPSPPSLSAHSVLGQILFDACVPKNIEGWDIKFSGSLNGQPFASAQKHSPLNTIKRMRSRL